MVAKAPTFIVEYGKDAESRRSDDRLCGPVFEKNHQFIGEVIKRLLGSRKGNVIEIGSGTGQHAARFARDFPNLTWWPTDLRPLHLKSIEAWRHYSGENNMMPSVLLDAAQAEWKLGKPNMPPSENVVAILCINVLHIAPWAVAEGIISAASHYLHPDGRLIIYGAFSRHGEHVSESNAAFDASLRDRDNNFGVRDIDDINAVAEKNGLCLSQVIDMPSNNFVLVLTRD